MLRIQDNNTGLFFDINRGTTITFEIHNPAFNYQIQQESFSYNIRLRTTQNNQRIFNFAHRLDVIGLSNDSRPVTIYLGLVPVFQGSLHLNKPYADGYQANITLNGGDFVRKLGDTLLTELDIPDELSLPHSRDYIGLSGMGTSIPGNAFPYFAFPTIYNPAFSDRTSNSYVNEYDTTNGDYFYNLAPTPNYQVAHRVCPMFFVEHIMWSFTQMMGYNIGVVNEDESIFNIAGLSRSLVIYNRTDNFDFYTLEPGAGLNRIYYRDHLPQMTAKNFFGEIAKLFSLHYRFDNQKKGITTQLNSSLLNENTLGVMDWTRQAKYKEYDDLGVNQRTAFGYADDLNKNSTFSKVVIGSTGKRQNIDLKIGSLAHQSNTLIPTDDLKGSIKSGSLSIGEPLLPRLLLYRYKGLVGGRPIATSAPTTDYDTSLFWDGSNGLYEQFHRPWAEFVNQGRIVPYNVQLSAKDLLSFDVQKQVKTRFGRYLIKKIQVKLTNSEFPLSQPANAELVEIP